MIEERQPVEQPLLTINELVRHYPVRRGLLFKRRIGDVRAVDGVTLSVGGGETLALVGESGCGKSTLARLIMRLDKSDAGSMHFHGADALALAGKSLLNYRRQVQMVFQDPYMSLNPRETIGQAIINAWEIHPDIVDRPARRTRCADLLKMVGLGADRIDWYPHQLSGGQRQRVAIARAIALNPQLIICDEPVSALDVSIQAQILNLLNNLQDRLGISLVFISHDLRVVQQVAHRVAVMYLGRIVEEGFVQDIFESPRHPYTEALLSAIPRADPDQRRLETAAPLRGEPANPSSLPSGCRFRTRCVYATEICAQTEPSLAPTRSGRKVACHFPRGEESIIAGTAR